MSEQAASGGSSAHEAGTVTQSDKGKNKATDSTADVNMDDDESSSGESDEEDQDGEDEPEPADEDNMEEIDTENIISNSRRTRGKTVDYVKAAQETPEEDADEDEDEDFEDPGDEMKD